MCPSVGNNDSTPIARSTIYYLAYAVGFAVLFNAGTSSVALFAGLSPLERAIINGPIVASLLLTSKLILLRPFSTTLVVGIAATISILTLAFGPPHPFKPVFILGGLAFDIGCLFQTKRLRFWHLWLAMLLYGVVVGFLYVFTIGIVAPQAVDVVKALIIPAIAILIGSGWVLSYPLIRFIPPSNGAPRWAQRVRSRVRSALS